MIDKLKANVNKEIEIVRGISRQFGLLETAKPSEKKVIEMNINSLQKSLKILNNSAPEILRGISGVGNKIGKTNEKKGIGGKIGAKKKTAITEIEIEGGDRLAVPEDMKRAFLKELNINEKFLKKIKTHEKEKEKEKGYEFKKSRGYLKLANKYFLGKSKELKNQKNFQQLGIEIKRANLEILTETYIAMMILTTIISVFVGFFLMALLMFFSLQLTPPFIKIFDGNYFLRFAQVFWIVIAIPVGTFFTLYFYPSLEKKSLANKIEQELPFAVIHMGAIAGSGISPVELFRIVVMGEEYPNLKKEIRKVLNEINFYGYDIVTALALASKNSPSPKLSELFTGLSTNIYSGGDLKNFFEKRAETLLTEYRLERDKYTKTVETFMDIYISIVIAAPMILMLLMIIISVSGIGPGFSPRELTFIIIMVLGLLNFFAIGFLSMRQPKY